MSKKILTIAIPSYNIEKFALKCFDSLILEKDMDAYEVLIIDDGSKDRTKAIAEQYVEKYPNTFRYIYKNNGGHGSVINKGIELASGKYFRVLDGDDWFDSKEFMKFLEKLKSINSDLIAENHRRVYQESKKIVDYTFNAFEYFKEFSFEEIALKMAKKDDFIGIHSFVIKTSILQDNKIRVSEKLFYDDAEFTIYPLTYVKTITFCNTFSYAYRLENVGQSCSEAGMQKHCKDHEIILERMFLFYDRLVDEREGVKSYIRNRLAFLCITQFCIYFSYKYKENKLPNIKKLDNYVKTMNSDIYERINKGKSIKILRTFNFRFYWLFWILYRIGIKFFNI